MNVEKLNDDKLLKSFHESFSPNQISSKLWLVKELRKYLPLGTCNIEIVGGWFGYPLIYFIRKYITGCDKIYFYDIDKQACEICRVYNNLWGEEKVIIKCQDYWKDFSKRKNIDCIINTSSEHMIEVHSLNINLYDNPLIAIQSNDIVMDEHVNITTSADELSENHDFSEILYKGQLKILDNISKNNRYMVIGRI